MILKQAQPYIAVRLEELAALDPVTVYIEENGPGRATLTVRCYDRAWTCYWGAMGQNTAVQFLCSVDAHYIANCLIRGNRNVITKRQAEDREMAYLVRICEAVRDAAARLGGQE